MEQLCFFDKSLILPIESSKLAHKNTYGIRDPSQLAEMPCSNQNSLYIYMLSCLQSSLYIHPTNTSMHFNQKSRHLSFQVQDLTFKRCSNSNFSKKINQLCYLLGSFLLVLPFLPLFLHNFSLFLYLLWPSKYGLSRPRLSFCLGLKNNLQLAYLLGD